MRKLAFLPIVALFMGQFLGVPSTAHAQVLPNCAPSHSGPSPAPDTIKCAGSDAGSGSEGATSGSNNAQYLQTSDSSGPPVKFIAYDQVTTGPDGQPCVRTAYYAQGGGPVNAAPSLTPPPEASAGSGGYNNIYQEYPPCPEEPLRPGQPAPALTRAGIAARAWQQRVILPKPRPSIAPGRAIAGKPAYLETGGTLSYTYTEQSTFGTLRIDASGSYTVDWGDGETDGPFRSEGLSWPSGQITHEYQSIGRYDVSVRERWEATWSLGGESGASCGPWKPPAPFADFPVEQIQAVIVR